MNEVMPGRMIHLGYGKYARSEKIVALERVEDEKRGPKLRTYVYIERSASSGMLIRASRSEKAILRDMTALPEMPSGTLEIQGVDQWDNPVKENVNFTPAAYHVDEAELVKRALSQTDGVMREAVKLLPFGLSKAYKIIRENKIDLAAFRGQLAAEEPHEEHHDDLQDLLV